MDKLLFNRVIIIIPIVENTHGKNKMKNNYNRTIIVNLTLYRTFMYIESYVYIVAKIFTAKYVPFIDYI